MAAPARSRDAHQPQADLRRRLGPARDARALRQRRPTTSAARSSPRRARARRSNSAARSSPCPPRRATSATSRARPDAHDRSPAWSPDGKSLAWFSDEGGEYSLHIAASGPSGSTPDASVAKRRLKLNGAGFYSRPAWSPDGQKIAFEDNSQSLYWIDVKSGVTKKFASSHTYSPIDDIGHAWSPDSKWLAYTIDTQPLARAVFVYSLERDKTFQIADGLSSVSDPVFDPSGKYLYFFASTDEGPVRDWFSQWNHDARATRTIYLAVLRNDLPSPLARESDEEKGAAGGQERAATRKKKMRSRRRPPEPFRLDTDGHRVPHPRSSDSSRRLQQSSGGQLLGRSTTSRPLLTARRRSSGSISRREKTKRSWLRPTPTASRATARSSSTVPEPTGPSSPTDQEGRAQRGTHRRRQHRGAGSIRRSSGAQIFDEAWRINRDYFYAPNMHGTDWTAMRDKYCAAAPHTWRPARISIGSSSG